MITRHTHYTMIDYAKLERRAQRRRDIERMLQSDSPFMVGLGATILGAFLGTMVFFAMIL